MTVDQRVKKFLEDHRRDGPHCDACIAKVLRLGAGANRTMARNVTAPLSLTPGFQRGLGTCCKCGKRRLVIHCVA